MIFEMLLGMLRKVSKIIAMIMVIFSVGACGTTKKISSEDFIDHTEPADVLYNQALANLDAGNLSEARNKFKEVDRQHPYSEFSRKALLMMQFTSYRIGDYTASVNAGERYLNLYLGSDDAAYSQYLIGMSYYRQIIDVTRDQYSAKKLLEAMNKLIKNYPDSEYVEDAKTKIRIATNQLAAKHMFVGRYYQERGECLASINRFRIVVEGYSNTPQVEEALARLTQCYYALGLIQEAQSAAALLGHNFPDSPWYSHAYELLKKDGIPAKGHSDSWLGKLAKKLSR